MGVTGWSRALARQVTARLIHRHPNFTNSFNESNKNRPTHNRMSDVELFDFRDGRDRTNILDRQPVAGVNRKPDGCGQRRPVDQGAERRRVFGSVGIRTGVEFDGVGPKGFGLFDGRGIGIDKETGTNPRTFQARNGIRNHTPGTQHIQPAFRGHFGATLGNEGDGTGVQTLTKCYHLFGGGALQVEHRCDRCGESRDIVVLDVTPVLAQVRRYAVGTGLFAEQGGRHRVGLMPAACLSDRGDVVDVDIQALIRCNKFARHGQKALLTGSEVGQMRRVLIAMTLVATTACTSTATKSSGTAGAPVSRAPAGSANLNAAGGAMSPKAAVEGFLLAVKNQDLQAMSMIWGNEKGLARDQFSREELEKRLVIMQCNLNHDSWSYAMGLDGTTRAGEQDLRIELRQKNLKEQTMVTTIRGPGARWYVKNVDLTKLGPFCR